MISTIARFTQEDVYHLDGLNLYAFCRNNAVMYVDPSGYAANYVTYIDREIKIDGKVDVNLVAAQIMI